MAARRLAAHVKSLSAWPSRATGRIFNAEVIMQPSEGFRLSPQQKRLWQLQTSQNTAYRTQGIVLIEGPLQAARLLAALQQVVDRNEILRTTFHRRSGMALAVQVIAEDTLATLEQ